MATQIEPLHGCSTKFVQEDLNYLKAQLEKHHANLYVYSTPKEIDDWFKYQEAQLPDSLTTLEIFKMITLPYSKILFTTPKGQYKLRADLTKIGLGVIPYYGTF